MFSAEFKLDPRDGRFKLLEVNTRPWWYVDFAARCGVDVCTMAYRDALGEGVDTVESYRTGVVCVYPYMDLSACQALRRSGRRGRRRSGRRQDLRITPPWPPSESTLTSMAGWQ